MPCSQRQQQAGYEARCARGDCLVDCFGTYYSGAPAGLDSKAQAAVAFETFIRFFQDNGLTCKTILKPGDKVDLSTQIWASDLTEEGNRFLETVELRWARYLDRHGAPTDTSMLARALAQLRNPQMGADIRPASDQAGANAPKQGRAGKRKKERTALPKSHVPPERAKQPNEASADDDPCVYDKAKWHYEGDFPKDLPQKQAFVHTGLFAGWLMEHDMISEDFLPEVERFKRREITGPQAYEIWDGGLDSNMLTTEGNQFAQAYYKRRFFDDYEKVLGRGLPSSYQVQDTWENYDKLKTQIDARYTAWKKRHARGKHKKTGR